MQLKCEKECQSSSKVNLIHRNRYIYFLNCQYNCICHMSIIYKLMCEENINMYNIYSNIKLHIKSNMVDTMIVIIQ